MSTLFHGTWWDKKQSLDNLMAGRFTRLFPEDSDPVNGTDLERLALLAETTTRLTSTLDVDEALRRLVDLVLPRLADWAVIDLITERDEVWRTAAEHQVSPRLAAHMLAVGRVAEATRTRGLYP